MGRVETSLALVAKTKGDKIVDEEEGGANGGAATASFKSGVARAARNMPKRSDQFGRTEKERVLNEQVREEIETAGFAVRSGLNRRSRGRKQTDRILGERPSV